MAFFISTPSGVPTCMTPNQIKALVLLLSREIARTPNDDPQLEELINLSLDLAEENARPNTRKAERPDRTQQIEQAALHKSSGGVLK